MPILPFGEFLPDLPDFANPGSANIQNVLPATQSSYGPMPTPVVYSGALTARCQGGYSLRDNAGNVNVFAGDAKRLYLLQSGSTAFADVSKSAGGPYSTPAAPDSGAFWSMTSFGTRVIATNRIDPIQSFVVGSSSLFGDLSALAPKAQYCVTIKDFLFLGNLVDSVAGSVPRRVQWSGVGDPANFPTPGSDAAISVQSDYQDLEQTDLGQITGLVGGGLASADGAAFCERGIYRIAYTGSPAIFDFAVAQGSAGTQSPLSLVLRRLTTSFGTRGVCYYLGEEGFYAYDGAASLPVGAQKIDKFFFRDLDPAYLPFVIGAADPINKIVFWAYHGAASGGLYNRLLAYNWDINRWAPIDISDTPAEWLTRAMTIGYTLDQLDIFGTLDTLPFSLDSRIWTGGKPALSIFDANHKLNFMTGPAMAPSLETSETQLFPGRRARIRGARPLADDGVPSVAHGSRERTVDPVVYQPAVAINALGDCPQRSEGRYSRFRMTLPAASTFTHLQGVDIDARPSSRRR